MRVIILDKNSHLKFHSISLAFLVRKKDQKQISLEITRQRNKHSMTGFVMIQKQKQCRLSRTHLCTMRMKFNQIFHAKNLQNTQ